MPSRRLKSHSIPILCGAAALLVACSRTPRVEDSYAEVALEVGDAIPPIEGDALGDFRIERRPDGPVLPSQKLFGPADEQEIEAKDHISKGKKEELTGAMGKSLDKANAGDAVKAKLKENMEKRADQIIKDKVVAAATMTLVVQSEAQGILVKYIITLLPKEFSPIPGKATADEKRKIVKTHEEGHRRVHKACVAALNNRLAAAKIVGKKMSDLAKLLTACQDVAQQQFHKDFAHEVGLTADKLKGSTDFDKDLKKLQDDAVTNANKAGEKAIDDALK